MSKILGKVRELVRSGALAPLVALGAGVAVTYLAGAVRLYEKRLEELDKAIGERETALEETPPGAELVGELVDELAAATP